MKSLKDKILDDAIELDQLLDLCTQVSDVCDIRQKFVERYGESFVLQRSDLQTQQEWLDFGKSLESGMSWNYGILLNQIPKEGYGRSGTLYELFPARKYPLQHKTNYVRKAIIEGSFPKEGVRGWMSYTCIEGNLSIPSDTRLWFYDDEEIGQELKNDIIRIAVESFFKILQTTYMYISGQENQNQDELELDDVIALIKEDIDEDGEASSEFRTSNRDEFYLFELKLYEVFLP